MKIAVVLCALIAVTLAKYCDHQHPCTCHHADQVANCENHQCTCVSTGTGKRANHECMVDVDCGGYDCHGHGPAKCIHHGSTEHGHNICGCDHHKRANHECMVDVDCGGYDCHGHGPAKCIHHGSTEHGHNICGCDHHKRANECMIDEDCSGFDCHGHGDPMCHHHGITEHGHNTCGCKHH